MIATPGKAQLAITEVMAYANQIEGSTSRRPDFWELTNFGDDTVNLDGYAFHDDDSGLVIWEPFVGLTIGGAESIIFCRTNATFTNTAAFVAWWGAAALPPDIQLRAYFRPGFDEAVGEGLWLLDSAGNVVDTVRFSASILGHTKTYNPLTGVFDVDSEPGVAGAFRSAQESRDVGSPGRTSGAVPVFVIRQPSSQVVDCCGPASFRVEAGGMPRPSYQWTSNGIPIPDATGPVLVLPLVAADSGGTFRVILSSAAGTLLSAPATLTVNTTPSRPWFVTGLEDAELFPGQRVHLSADIRGYPLPRHQWLSNGIAIPGATSPGLTVAAALDSKLGTSTYTLVISNSLGRAESSSRVTVTRRPILQITEVMPEPTNSTALPPPGLKPWFEVTNADTNAVNLKGYRFRDSSSLSAATVITSNLVLRPGESIIFVDTMSRDAFIQWWGDDRLPLGLKVVTWFGWSLDSKANDIIYLWNAHPTDYLDIVANTSYKPAKSGFSQEPQITCDEWGCIGWDPIDSIAGVNGAFVSLTATNAGSPGFIDFPDPYFTRLTQTGTTVQLRCRLVPGRRYRLQARDRFDSGSAWTTFQTVTATNIVMTIPVPSPATATRFYRIEELP